MAKKHSKIGLNEHGRIDWDLFENLSCFALACNSPLYGKMIGKVAGGLTQQQVYERCRQFSGGLKALRNGNSPFTKVIISKYAVSTMKQSIANELLKELDVALKLIK